LSVYCLSKITANARVYDQLRNKALLYFTSLGRSMKDVSVLYIDSDTHSLNQAID
jgi:hypothetical protein